MKVNKIEIKQELIEVPDNKPYFDEMIIPGIQAIILNEGEVPPMATFDCERVRYELKVVRERDEIRNYFVKTNDFKIFNDLLVISDADIKKVKNISYLTGRIESLRSFISFLQLNKIMKFLFKNKIQSLEEVLKGLELDCYLYSK